MKAATVTVEARIRGLRVAGLLMRVANLIGSVWLARRAVRLIRVESRIGQGRWAHVPMNIDVERVA